jgi:exosome complex component RRP41
VYCAFEFYDYSFRFRMAGLQLLSEYGLRVDGRRPNELRQIRCKLGVFNQPDGSAYLEQGNTKVLAAVYGPHEVTFWLAFV